MSEARSWELTPREIQALYDVFHSRVLEPWATTRADFANVHFREQGTAAFIADDFLGEGNRVQRGLDQAKEKVAVMKYNQQLQTIRPNAPPTDAVPAWAIGGYREQKVEASQHAN